LLCVFVVDVDDDVVVELVLDPLALFTIGTSIPPLLGLCDPTDNLSSSNSSSESITVSAVGCGGKLGGNKLMLRYFRLPVVLLLTERKRGVYFPNKKKKNTHSRYIRKGQKEVLLFI